MRSAVDIAMRIFLPLYFITYILLGYTFTVASFKKKYGFDPRTVAQPDPVMELGETYRNVLFAIALAMIVAYAIYPPVLSYLGPISVLDTPTLRLIGAAILVGSLVLVRLGQREMGRSWRFGFDMAGPPTDLVTSGMFSRTRNPIYLGMVGLGVGLFTVLPNAVTLTVAALTLLILQTRVLVEERYLLAKHGEAYSAYCGTTPRWLFRKQRRAAAAVGVDRA